MSNFNNRVGQRYGRLLVLERSQDHIFSSGRKVVKWKCLCDCGNICEIATTSLGSGATTSCGCWNKEQQLKSDTKYHNSDKIKNKTLYERWRSIKRRCYEQNNEHYKYYGARGIKMCDEWKNNFDNFYKWSLKNGWNPTLTIDRIDVNGDYEPNNCRWVNHQIQQRNKTNNRLITFKGETHTLIEWSEITNINRSTISTRIDRLKWPIEKALTTPVK